MDYSQIPSPCYVVDEALLRRNLALIRSVKERAGVDIILAFKAFANWPLFPIVREYIPYSTASSLWEARLAYEQMETKAHTFAPVYTDTEFDEIALRSSHITFNSLHQFERYCDRAERFGVSCGLRINPIFCAVETDLYNPCIAGSRLGVPRNQIGARLPKGIKGLHVHALCESSAQDTEHLIQAVEEQFGDLLEQIEWVNFGGGHLMTRAGYDVEHLIKVLCNFRARHPQLRVILEPGSAFAWQTGVLVSQVQDVVENAGIRTAILNVSFACHMPDCLEMPYQPAIEGARMGNEGPCVYRMGGNSCLSGDYVGDWSFDHPLQVGEFVVFMDMIHYTTVKTTFFNGVTHPSIGLWTQEGCFKLLRSFGYEDYKSRLG